LYPVAIERRCEMREVNIQPQSWDVVDDDQEDGRVAEKPGETAEKPGETDVEYSFNYARA
jgi:hypothetical protein